MSDTLRFLQAATVEAARGDGDQPRTIRGLAVPWNTVAAVASGQKVKFLPGALPVEGRAPKLLAYHDQERPLGVVIQRQTTDAGMEYVARISKTAAGDDALVLAADGVLDQVSVGVNPVEYRFEGDVMVVARGDWVELSLVPVGAFAGASVDQVTATPTDPSKETPAMSDPIAPVAADPVVAALPEPVLAGMIQSAATMIARRSEPRRILTVGEYLAARYQGGAAWAAIRAADQDTDDSTGILPEPIVGAVYDALRVRRPIIESIGVLAMPGTGRTFTRPKVVTHTKVQLQTVELDPLGSQAMVIEPETVTKKTYGGFVQLSEQDVDWTDPGALQLVVADLAKQYAIQTETVAAAALEAAAGETEEVSDWTDPDIVLGAIWDASITVSDGDEADFATTIWASPDRCKALGLLKSGDQYLFPALNPSNGMGSMLPTAAGGGEAAGLRVVRAGKLSAGTMIVGNGSGLELYEQRKGSLQASDPSTLGVTVAFRGYFATLAIDEDRFVALVDPS